MAKATPPTTLADIREHHKAVGQLGAFNDLPALTRCACGQLLTPDAYENHVEDAIDAFMIPIWCFRDEVSEYVPAVRLAITKIKGANDPVPSTSMIAKIIGAYVTSVLTTMGKAP